MTPPRPALALAAPIPREDPDDDPHVSDVRPLLPADPELTAQRVDALIDVEREQRRELTRQRRRARRLALVQLSTARRARRAEHLIGDVLEGQGRMAADVSRALAGTKARATVAAASPVIAAAIYFLAHLIGD